MTEFKKISRKDRFLPCFLERLTDNEPNEKILDKENYYFYSIKNLKKYILKDVANLLNSKSKISEEKLKKYPELANSVINYGLDDKCGTSYYNVDISLLAEVIKEAIIRFEPRIDSERLIVEIIETTNKDRSRSTYGVVIKGLLNVASITEELLIKSEIDIENGNIKIIEEGFDG
jgi:type VI secretion system protein ImpF